MYMPTIYNYTCMYYRCQLQLLYVSSVHVVKVFSSNIGMVMHLYANLALILALTHIGTSYDRTSKAISPLAHATRIRRKFLQVF